MGLLQRGLHAPLSTEIQIIQDALRRSGLDEYADIILEYDLRRRGLRIDCILLAPGIVAVLEFKRTRPTHADADQVTNYCVNLVEFHEETRRCVEEEQVIVAPVLVQTTGSSTVIKSIIPEFHPPPWGAILRDPVRCDSSGLSDVLVGLTKMRRSDARVNRRAWIASSFAPSSTILDAAISLFGQHDVSAIRQHAGTIEQIDATVEEVVRQVSSARAQRQNTIVFVSGAPGAGKTLVGLRLAFDERFRTDAVFVTGNAPLVDVLTEALRRSYKSTSRAATKISGYPRESARLLIENATFKIVEAHRFLGERGRPTASSDGSIVVFDEAQRTYERGRVVLGRPLSDHEADLILSSLEMSYAGDAVVVALLGHNQAINRGERGLVAWLEAAERRGWRYAISDESLGLGELGNAEHWRDHPARVAMEAGHLSTSLRFYRNSFVESWAHCVMENDPAGAQELGERLGTEGHQVWITRDLETARAWAREHRVGDERSGLIASGQARRLAAEGLFVDQKPSIAHWMLAPSGDVRSSNMLETVQNQYQIQGLELDYAIVCWDADLRRSRAGWEAWKLSGSTWRKDRALDVAKNSYRVLLTRARKGMILFVPKGDESGEDETRAPSLYEQIVEYLVSCGAREWPRSLREI